MLIGQPWFNIDSEVTPYLRALKSIIENDVHLFTKSELLSANIVPVAASEELFVSLRLYRYVLRSKMVRRSIKYGGQVEQVPALEEFPITGLSSKPHRKILILGSAGMGKTTSLLRIAYMMCEKSLKDLENIKIPIFLRAQEIVQANATDLIDICAVKTMELARSSKPSFTSKDLNDGNVCVLVDALDEIPDRSEQKRIVNKSLEFHSVYPACQIVITSRDYSYIGEIEELRGFVEYKLCPISLKQAEKIVHNLQKKSSLPIEKSSEILRRIQDVHGMELNPLLVTVFAATTDYSRSDIPANITELFKKFTELMLGRWDASKGMALQHQAPLKDFILQHVAHEMHRRRVTKLSIDEFKSISSKELESRGYKTDVEQLNEEMLHRSGLFRILDNNIEFRHLMLQEFFAGRGIPNLESLESIIVDDWWRRAIVFYFGENPGDDSAFIRIKTSLTIKTPAEIYNALITIGLSLQASYLVKVDSKIPTFIWLIKNLSEVQRAYEQDVVSLAKYPLNKFVIYYLLSREAVALNIIGTYIQNIKNGLKEQSETKTLSELEEFWLIIGLIETGALSEAEKFVRRFNPSDLRLLLGIHLSCFLIQYTRITNRSEKLNAEKICGLLESRIMSLRKQLQDEFKSELLEIRQDKIEVDTERK